MRKCYFVEQLKWMEPQLMKLMGLTRWPSLAHYGSVPSTPAAQARFAGFLLPVGSRCNKSQTKPRAAPEVAALPCQDTAKQPVLAQVPSQCPRAASQQQTSLFWRQSPLGTGSADNATYNIVIIAYNSKKIELTMQQLYLRSCHDMLHASAVTECVHDETWPRSPCHGVRRPLLGDFSA